MLANALLKGDLAGLGVIFLVRFFAIGFLEQWFLILRAIKSQFIELAFLRSR